MIREFVFINFSKIIVKESISVCILCIIIIFKYMVEIVIVIDNFRRLLNIYIDIF